MNIRLLPALAAGLTISLGLFACTNAPQAERVDDAAAAPLVDTRWQLTQLGEQVITGAPGANAVSLQLQAQNLRLTGFAGCNRMFGGYSLNGDQLKFDQIGATKMACVDEARMRLEQDYFEMLTRVARWKISGNQLALEDSEGAVLGTFVASAALE
jgi:heat shock protein HslJ